MSLFNKLNQIKDLRHQAKTLQSQLSQESVTIEKQGVEMIMDGNQKITKLEINPEYFTPEKKDKLQKLLIEIHEDAIHKIQRIMAEKIKNSGDFKIPGLN
jgi:DNA-binding protein YbaB